MAAAAVSIVPLLVEATAHSPSADTLRAISCLAQDPQVRTSHAL
jgi:hypothetical protein